MKIFKNMDFKNQVHFKIMFVHKGVKTEVKMYQTKQIDGWSIL